MTTLGANLSSSADELRVNAAVNDPAPYYQIDSEIVQVLQASKDVLYPITSPNRTNDPTLWSIKRAISGTTAASHNSGATMTPVYVPNTTVVGTPVTLRSEEVEIPFDAANIDTGATLFTIPNGDRVLTITSFVASALTETGGALSIGVDGNFTFLSAHTLGNYPDPKVGLFSPESVQAAGADVVLTVKRVAGTWTGGSVRFSFLIATPS